MGGPGKIIQVDECLLQGKRKANNCRFRSADLPYERLTDENDLNASNTSRNYGSRLSGQWVVGLVEKLDDNASDALFLSSKVEIAVPFIILLNAKSKQVQPFILIVGSATTASHHLDLFIQQSTTVNILSIQ